MSLLSVTVKKARYVGIQATQFNTYVTLKLQNVKSTTVTVKGPTPCWEQDFLFEINDINLGLLVEVWNKGVIWDRALGYHYLPLTSVAYNEECGGRWVELEAQLMMRGGAVVGTSGPTGHALLLDCRFEPPFDAEGTGGADLQRKLDLLNGTLDAERAEQARRQLQYVAHSGYSEDSDYTSDLNYPVGQHANCSASQFRSAAHQMHTPQRSLEASRENSYERDEYHMHGDTDPLYYNSQPRTNRIDTWSQLHAQASVESAISWRTAADWHSGEEQRRPSLERQNTLYDDGMGYGYDPYTTSTHIRDHSHISHQPSYEEYYDSSSYPYPPYETQWDGRYLYDECGLTPTEYENIVNKRRSSVVQLPQMPPKQLPPSSRYSDYNEMAPYRPRPRRTAASLPATPSSTPKRGRALPLPPGSESSWTSGGRRGRKLPRPPQHTPRVQPTPPAPAPQPAYAAPAHSVQSALTHTHVPYSSEADRTVPEVSYGYDSFGYQPQQYKDTAIDQYQDSNYNTSYDEDGMQPFFDETPHATPPAAAAQKPTWGETDTTTQFSYTVASVEDSLIPKSMSATTQSYTQPPVTSKQDIYQEQSFRKYDSTYEEKQQFLKFETDQTYSKDKNQFVDQSFQKQQEQQQQPPKERSFFSKFLPQLLPQQQEQKQHQWQEQKQVDKQSFQQTEYDQQKQYDQEKQYEQQNKYEQQRQYEDKPFDQQYGQEKYDQPQYEEQKYDQQQYDQKQYDSLQYDQTGYDQQELDQKPYEQEQYDQKPYEQQQYDQKPYEQQQYDQKSYEQQQYDQKPYEQQQYDQKPYEQQQYEQKPYEQQQYDQKPYEQQQYDQKPYDQQQYDQKQYDQQQYDQQQYDQKKYDQEQYDQKTYDQKQYDQKQYDEKQYDQQKFDQQKYDDQTYDQKQFNQDQYDQKQFDQQQYDQQQYDQKPYDNQQYDQHQYDQQQYGEQRYDDQQYDQQKYDQEHYNQQKYDQQSYEQQRQYDQQPYDQEYDQQQQQKQDQLQQEYQQQQKQQQDILNQAQKQQEQQLQQQQQKQQQQQQQQIPIPPAAQQIQATVLTGAATLGGLFAGGAKKLGSFFGAAAAAVGAPAMSQPQPATTASVTTTPAAQFTSATAPATSIPSETTTAAMSSVPEVSQPVATSTVATSSPASLPRTPSLRRQESIQRPSVRRTRTLPDAPDPPSSFDESAYEDEYNKTEIDQTDRIERTSLDRYREDDFAHDTIHEDVAEEEHMPEEPSTKIPKTSPSRSSSIARKPSVDSYHSQTPSVLDRKTSQSSFQRIPSTQEEPITDKSKVTFKEERPTKYHEVPEPNKFRETRDSFDDTANEYPDDLQDQDEAFREEEKYDDQDHFQEGDEQYQEEDVFPEDQERQEEEPLDFQPQQPKLTPKQRWHRAYNKIVMKRVSDFPIIDDEIRCFYRKYLMTFI